MPDIIKREQTGGWHNISIILTEEITSTPTYLTNENSNLIVFTPVDDGLDIFPVGENITITENSSKTKAGDIYNIQGRFEVETQTKELDSYLKQFLNRDVVFLGIKHSGEQKLYGSLKYPLEFKYQFIDGTNLEDSSKIRITISGKIPQKPVFIDVSE